MENKQMNIIHKRKIRANDGDFQSGNNRWGNKKQNKTTKNKDELSSMPPSFGTMF